MTMNLTCALICLPALMAISVPAATNPATIPDAATAATPDAHLDYTPGKAPPFWSVATAGTIMARWPNYNLAYHASWTYVHGYALYGFDMLYRATGDKRYYDFIKRYIDKHLDENGNFRAVADGRGRTRATGFTNLDNLMTGNTVVMLYEYTRDARYKKAADTIRHALDNYPRNNDGGFWHSTGMHGQMWIDGIFMGQMFLTRYGKSIADTPYCWDEATTQMTVYAKRAERDHTGLYLHGIYEPGHGSRECRWADPKTGRSPEVWSEGLGWYALVLVETLADLPKDHARRVEMEDIFRRLAAGLQRTQDPKSGRWFQVVDKGDRPDNWTDTSGSAMFTYALQKGIEVGLLDKAQYAGVVARGYQGIIANARINDKGLVDIYSACDGVGVQVSYDRYIHYKQSINAKEAVAGFLWATAIVEKPDLEKLRK
jgi:unsaturated rhamnogalacturonyl hydrolase